MPPVHQRRPARVRDRPQAVRRGRDAVAAEALLYGFFGSNRGDLAVTRGAVELIRAAGAGRDLTVVAAPLRSGQRAGWRGTARHFDGLSLREWDVSLAALRHDRPPEPELLDALLDTPPVREALAMSSGVAGARRVFYGGGEHVFSYGRPEDDWNLLGRLLPLLAAARAGAEVIGLPATIGPLETPFARAVTRRFAEAARLIMVRDSRSLLEGLGAVEGLDPAFFLGSTARARPLFRRAPLRVALVLRLEDTGLRAGPSSSRSALARARRDDFASSHALATFKAIGERLLAAGHELRVLVQSEPDRAPSRALAAALGARLVEPGSLAQYVRELSFCQAVLTSRFHSAIFALSAGAVPIGIYGRGHGHKMPGLFEMLDEPGLAIPLEDGAEPVLAALDRLRADRPGAGAELAERVAGRREATLERLRAALAAAA